MLKKSFRKALDILSARRLLLCETPTSKQFLISDGAWRLALVIRR
jgi:hypothetical protein